MRETIRVLQLAVSGGFLFLAAAAARAWGRREERVRPYLALALGFIGLTSLLSQLGAITRYDLPLLQDAVVVCFAASAYFLLMFRHEFVPISARMQRVAIAALAIGAGAAIVFGRPPNEPRTTSAAIAGLVLVAAWVACVGEPAWRLWNAGRARPAVQRARLRALSVGYATLAALIVVAGLVPVREHPVEQLLIQIVGLTLVPVIYASFAPPPWLRRAWRHREEEDVRLAEALAAFAPGPATLSQRALDGALRIVGGDSGFVAAGDGRILARRAMADDDVHALVRRLRERPERRVAHVAGEPARHAILLPLPTRGGTGVLGVVSGPFTPVFGSDEAARLQDYAASIGVALDRAGLVEALQQQTDRYEALLQAVSDLGQGFVVAERGRLVHANEAYCAMTGYSLEELKGLPSLIDLSPPEERAVLEDRLRRRLEGGHVTDHYEGRLVRKDGRTLHVEAAVKLIRAPDGNARLFSLVRDVTTRAEAEAALRQKTADLELLQAISAAANEATGIEEVVRVALARVCAYSGWPVGHAYLPDDFGDVLVPTGIWHDDARSRPSAFRDATERTRLRRGMGLPGRVYETGKPAWIEDAEADDDFRRADAAVASGLRAGFAFPILIGSEVVGVLEFFAERPIAPDESFLAVMTHIGTQLGRVVERVRIEELRNRFIANAAHELRTPLTSMIGFTSLLATRRHDLGDVEVDRMIEALNRQGQRLRALITNLLDFTRLQDGRIQLDVERVPVRDLITQATDAAPPPDHTELHVHAADGLVAMADGTRVDQILINLLTNAYRHGGRTVSIAAATEGDDVVVTVSDDGPGVAPELVPQLFDAFARGEHSERVGGSGLGLAIARMLARAQGGDLRYEPNEPNGARFALRLKVAP